MLAASAASKPAPASNGDRMRMLTLMTHGFTQGALRSMRDVRRLTVPITEPTIRNGTSNYQELAATRLRVRRNMVMNDGA
jgi:hypothetical protein